MCNSTDFKSLGMHLLPSLTWDFNQSLVPWGLFPLGEEIRTGVGYLWCNLGWQQEMYNSLFPWAQDELLMGDSFFANCSKPPSDSTQLKSSLARIFLWLCMQDLFVLCLVFSFFSGFLLCFPDSVNPSTSPHPPFKLIPRKVPLPRGLNSRAALLVLWCHACEWAGGYYNFLK